MDEALIEKIGIALTPGIRPEIIEAMEENDVGFDEFFSLGMRQLNERLGGGSKLRLEDSKRSEAMSKARKEYEFVKRHNIRCLFITDDDYPPLLRECHDAPVMLFALGDADLNPRHTLSIVGTRRCTQYGTSFVKDFLADMAVYFPDLLVISGLAFGIDATAHQAALDNRLPTVGVLAHGLDMIYPAQNRYLGKEIINAGGVLISEYPSGTVPYRNNFLLRNRIVAGLSEITIVAESEIKGGAMNTAHQAFINNREVMVLPGRSNDIMSSGCNHLIRKQKANLITCAADLIELTGWAPLDLNDIPRQRILFPELEGLAADIYNIMRGVASPVTADAIKLKIGASIKDIISTMSEMEFEGIINKLPGARYELA